jgi:hypothetical protein
VQVVDELMHCGAAVRAYQQPVTDPDRQLREGVGEHRDVIGGIVRARPSLIQHRPDALAGAARAVIDERRQRVEPEGVPVD